MAYTTSLLSRVTRTQSPGRLILSAICFVFLTSTSFGFMTNDEIVYGSVSGPDVTFKNVTEISTTDSFELVDGEMIGLYGSPTMNGNVLSFTTPSFAANVTAGPPFGDTTDGLLSTEIVAESGTFIEYLFLEEFGSIGLSSGDGSPVTRVNVEAPVFLTVREVLLDDGTAEGMLYTLPDAETVSDLMDVYPERNTPPSPGWNSMDHAGVDTWFAELLMDVPAALADRGVTGVGDMSIRGFTRAELTMDNRLTAVAADEFSLAFIDKKGIHINPFPAQTPEPGASLLLLQALLVGLPVWRSVHKRQTA